MKNKRKDIKMEAFDYIVLLAFVWQWGLAGLWAFIAWGVLSFVLEGDK